jgi:hypothetical protein
MDVTLAWMGGVVAAMLIFAGFALVGYLKKRARDAQQDSSD